MTREPISIDSKDISSHLRAAHEALERALEIFHDDYAARHETASAISDVEVAYEIIGKLAALHPKPDDETGSAEE
jgi:hypothetical protein